MIDGLKPYADYKSSGLPWLGQVPAHWEVRRIKTVLREVDRRSSAGMEPLLSLRMQAGLVDHHALGGKPIPPSALVGYKRVLPGEIVMNRMRASAGLFAAATSDGLVSPDYAIFRLVGRVNVAYAVQLFRTPAMSAVFRLESTGLGTGESGFLRLYSDQFGRLAIPTPPIGEQDAIVRFLDWATGRLDRAIRAKRKVIALLMEQKQTTIRQAVTRGVDRTVPFKPSGVNWLGEIPKHWEVRKLKFLVTSVGGMTPNKSTTRFWGGRVPWVSPKDMKVREIVDSRDHITEAALRSTGISLVAPPAVLIVVRGMILARTFPAAVTTVAVTVNQDMKALVPASCVNASFLASLLTGIQHDLLQLVEEAGHGTRCLRTDSWANFSVPLPPIREQKQINDVLTAQLAGVNSAISRLDSEIGLLREYRARLVGDVVTGKLDVRQAAMGLRDEGGAEADDDVAAEPEDAELADEEATEA